MIWIINVIFQRKKTLILAVSIVGNGEGASVIHARNAITVNQRDGDFEEFVLVGSAFADFVPAALESAVSDGDRAKSIYKSSLKLPEGLNIMKYSWR